MKKSSSFISPRHYGLFLLFFGTVFFVNTLFAQTPDDLNDDGTEILVSFDEDALVQDFIIPANSTATFLRVRLDGGDGGRRPSCNQGGRGGKGANIYATFPVGDDDNSLKPGGTIRMVIGQKGTNVNTTEGGGGGGGGGTGLLYLSPDATGVDDAEFPELDISSANSAWILLAVAGGGGGGFGVQESVGFGNCESATAKNGTGGNETSNGTGGGGNNTGGVNGNGGFSGGSNDGGGGGGYLFDGGPDESSQGHLGGISGGAGGTVIDGTTGGAGYGGGGGGVQGGGGGGGFSGGGGGNDGGSSANNGGGGGSWLNAIAIEGSIIILAGTTTNSPDDGFISYSFPRLNVTGDIEKLDDVEWAQDFTIPTDIDTDALNAITFTARGGDGGRARSQELNPNTGRGGEGALISADFEIGDGPQQLQPGGTLRFIVGKRGNSITFDNRSGAGGGGGTAILYKPPGVSGNGDCIVFGPNNETQAAPSLDINDDCWSILLVAGGGGGGYHTGEGDNNTGRNGLDANTGINGTTNSNDGDGAPGLNGGSGESPPGNSGATVRSGGGGGYLPLFPVGSTIPHPAQGTPGIFTGGPGGTNDNNFINGGFGYGGGGSGRINRNTGLHGGGGGGGYSGGGGGRSDPGGGGGSFVNAAALLSNIEEAPSSKTSFHGCLSYEFYFNPVTGPDASCNSIITATIDGTGEYELTADIVNAGSTNEGGGTNGLTLKLCKNIGNDLICGFNTFTYHCGNIGSTDEGLLQVSDGTEESYCAFTVEVIQGDVGTLVCPDPITTELEDCETTAQEILQPISGTSCSDVYSYQLTLPDGTLDELPVVAFNDENGQLVEDFSMLGVHNLSYTASFEDAEGEIQSQTCFTTITLVNAPADLENNVCPNDREIEIDKEDWDCSIPVGSGLGSGAYSANLELDYDGCGDVSWQVVSPGIDPIITTGTGQLEGFEFTPGISTVTYFVDIPGAETTTCSFTIELYPETNNRVQLNDEEPLLQCLGGGNNDIVIADGMTDQEIFDLLVTDYSDDCEIIDFEINNLDAQCAFIGDNQIATVMVWDAIGFTSCEVEMTIQDELGLTCPENIVVDTEFGLCEATISEEDLAPLTNYYCLDQQTATISEIDGSGLGILISSSTVINDYTFDAATNYLIEYQATSDDGHMSNCSFTVNVNDTEKPIAVCQNVSANTDDNPATVAAAIGASSTDNCGIASFSIDLDFTCDNVENSPVIIELTVSDEAGNTSTCLALVDLKDKTAPEFTVCPDFTLGGSTNQNACNFTLEDFTLNSFIQDGIEDDCGQVFTLSQFPEPGTLIEEESVEVTLEVLDESGNLSTSPCVFTVEREDLESPELNCLETYTATLGTDGQVVVDLDDLVLDITDNCTDEPFLSFDPFVLQMERTYNCSNVGTFDRRIFADDETGVNLTFCDVSITVEDPGLIAECQNATVSLDEDGNGSVNVNQIDNGSGSACSTISLSFDENIEETALNYTCMDLGPNAVVLHVSDDEGNMTNCAATVTVLGGDQLMAICQNLTVNLDDNGSGTLSVTDIDNGSTAGCTDPVLSFSPDMIQTELNYNCDDIGQFDVTLYITNPSLPTAMGSCMATITVEDEGAPTANCFPSLNIGLSESPITAAQLNNGSTDHCTAPEDLQLSLELAADGQPLGTSFDLDCSHIGSLNLRLRVTDEYSNFDLCDATTINVTDDIPPIANCQNVILQLEGNGSVTVTTAQVDDNSTDNCSALSFSFAEDTEISSLSFGCADQETTTMATLYVTDSNSNTSTCTTTLNITDPNDFCCDAPDAVCQNTTIQLDVLGNASLTTNQVDGGSDAQCGIQFITTLPNAFTCADVGPQNVTLTITDINGLADNCTAVVTIEDNIAPNAACVNDLITITLDANGNGILNVAEVNNGSTDACLPLSYSFAADEDISNLNYGCDDVGTEITVTLFVTDAHDNTNNCTATVAVVDNTPPFVDCQAGIVNLDENGNGTLQASDLNDNNGSSDACGPLHFSFDEAGLITSLDFSCDDIGMMDDFVYATDANGNTNAGCPVSIFIRDEVAPVASCQDVEIILDEQGTGAIDAADFDNGSSDACGELLFSFDQLGEQTSYDGFTCADIGEIPALVYITDEQGNQTSCAPNIMVKDEAAPSPVCQNVEVILDENGMGSIITTQVDNGSSDNCSTVNLSFDENTEVTSLDLDCDDVGDQEVTLYVKDSSENSASCEATISIIDDITPELSCPNIYSFYLDANGSNIMYPADFSNVIDNCLGDVVLSFDEQGLITERPFGCDDRTFNSADAHQVTVYATDAGGNTDQCTTNVRVVGGPQLTCAYPEPTVYLSAPEISISDIAVITPGSDPCYPDEDLTLCVKNFETPGSPFICEDFTLTCDDVGENVLFIATTTNPDGEKSSCIIRITVINDLEVQAVCQDVEVQLDENGSANISITDVDNGTTEACSPLTLSFAEDQELSTLSFTCDDTGDHTATLYVWDEAGNTSNCTTTISIEDDEKPTLFCNNIDVVAELASGTCDVFVELTVPEVVDNCDEFDLVWRYRQTDENGNNLLPWSLWKPSSEPYGTFMEGYYKIQWRATDLSGNRRRCLTYVTVTDPDGLPCPWANNHIDCAGSSSYDYDTEIFTLNSEDCHNPFSNSDDEYAFVSQTLCGNAEIIAQVTDISGNSNGWAGVMMRETNEVGSKMATLLTNRSANHRKEVRTSTNGNMTAQQSSAFNRHWLKLVRIGNSFRGYASSNGSTWFIKFSHTIAMDECIEVGLVLNGYTASSDVQATFANVSITGTNVAPSLPTDPPALETGNTNNFSVYPNPSNGFININMSEYTETEVVLEVLNVNGRVIYTIDSIEPSTQVDLRRQPAGIYAVRLRLTDGTEQIKRVVLQH